MRSGDSQIENFSKLFFKVYREYIQSKLKHANYPLKFNIKIEIPDDVTKLFENRMKQLSSTVGMVKLTRNKNPDNPFNAMLPLIQVLFSLDTFNSSLIAAQLNGLRTEISYQTRGVLKSSSGNSRPSKNFSLIVLNFDGKFS